MRTDLNDLDKAGEIYEEFLLQHEVCRGDEEHILCLLYTQEGRGADGKKKSTDVPLHFQSSEGMLRRHIEQLLERRPGVKKWGIYGATGTFNDGSLVMVKGVVEGRKKENLRRILHLAFDCDMKDWEDLQKRYSGSAEDTMKHLWVMEDEGLAELQERFIEFVKLTFQNANIPCTRIISSGYGCYMLIDIMSEDQGKIEELRMLTYHIGEYINKRAGYNMCDPGAKDAGTRLLRLDGSHNLKNPGKPRLVKVTEDNKVKYDCEGLRGLIPATFRRTEPQEPTEKKKPAKDTGKEFVGLFPDKEWDKMIPRLAERIKPHYKGGKLNLYGVQVSGYFPKEGVTESQALRFFEHLDPNLDNKQRKRIKATYKKFREGKDVEGYQGLKETMGEEGASDLKAFTLMFEPDTAVPVDTAVSKFPIDVFPKTLSEFFLTSAKSIWCPVDYLATNFLPTAGVVLGKGAEFEVKGSWSEYPRLVTINIGSGGTRKSTSLDRVVTKPIMGMIQEKLDEEYRVMIEDYKRAGVEYDQWKKDLRSKNPDIRQDAEGNILEPPDKPPRSMMGITDTTVEALLFRMNESGSGLIYIQDELNAWVLGMNQYKVKGSDRPIWLSIMTGADMTIIRKNMEEPLFVKSPFCNVTGGLTPAVVEDLRKGDRFKEDDGFLQRCLFSYPYDIERKWSDVEIPPEVIESYEKVVLDLWMLPSYTATFTKEGREVWDEFRDAHYKEMNEAEFVSELSGAWSKYEGITARIALVLQNCRYVCGETRTRNIDDVSMKGAWKVIDYYKSHFKRVTRYLRMTSKDKGVMNAINWIKRWVEKKGVSEVPARVLSMNEVNGLRKVDKVLELFAELQSLGYGEMVEGKTARSKSFRPFDQRKDEEE